MVQKSGPYRWNRVKKVLVLENHGGAFWWFSDIVRSATWNFFACFTSNTCNCIKHFWGVVWYSEKCDKYMFFCKRTTPTLKIHQLVLLDGIHSLRWFSACFHHLNCTIQLVVSAWMQFSLSFYWSYYKAWPFKSSWLKWNPSFGSTNSFSLKHGLTFHINCLCFTFLGFWKPSSFQHLSLWHLYGCV